MMRSAVGIAAVVLALDCVTAMDNGLALRPPLGWSTWQTCGDEVHGILDHPSLSPLFVSLPFYNRQPRICSVRKFVLSAM